MDKEKVLVEPKGNFNYEPNVINETVLHLDEYPYNTDTDISIRKLLREKHNFMIKNGTFDPEIFFRDFRAIWAERKSGYDKYTTEKVDIYDRPAPKNRKDINKVNNRLHAPYYYTIVYQVVSYLNSNPVVFDYDNSKELKTKMEKYQQDLLDDPDNLELKNFDDDPVELLEYEEIMHDIDIDTKLVEITTQMAATGVGYLFSDVYNKKYGRKNDEGVDEFTKFNAEVVDSWSAEHLGDSCVILRNNWTSEGNLFYTLEVWTKDKTTIYSSQVFDATINIWNTQLPMNFTVQKDLLGDEQTGVEEFANPIGELPLVEFINNYSLTSDFKQVDSLIQAVDKTISDQQNEIEQFRLAYLFMSGKGLSKEMAEELLSQSGIITTNDEGGNAKYITKELTHEFNEFHLNKLIEMIYANSNTINFNGDSFSGNSSSESRQWQIKGLSDRANLKELFLQKGMKDLSKLIEAFMKMPTSGYGDTDFDAYKVSVTFRPSLPIEISYLADAISKLDGVVSKQTLAKQVPFVEDGALEQRQLQLEKTQDMSAELAMTKMSADEQPTESMPGEENVNEQRGETSGKDGDGEQTPDED